MADPRDAGDSSDSGDSGDSGAWGETPPQRVASRDSGAEDPSAAAELGPAPAVAGAERIRSALRARLFGDDDELPAAPGESSDAPFDPQSSQLGPAPAVQGSDRIRSALRARLFGDGPSPSADPSDDDEDFEDRDHASRSGVISGLDTEPGDQVRRLPGEEPELAGRVGRFRVLDRLGRGGMGVVYSAYDPELDRKVAIKLLRPDVRRGMAERDAHARLMREAQAMARLSDPNVIVVHEVGTVGDRVFVAMEYIDGQTLGKWLSTGDHDWRAVLDVFVRAGSGLAAAHRAELVHRDFKPDNVLLGKEGQVRVVDFGLARSMAEEHKPTTPVRTQIEQRPELDSLATPLTRTGAVMGTPAYMSPEQYLGHPADARSDQFSFCVALYEGLYGVRPFEGNSLSNLAHNVTKGIIRETPADARVPKRLLTALRRGLSVDPAARYPSMEALLLELRRDPSRKWRWTALVLGGITLTSLATFAATQGTDASDACSGLERELVGVWDDEARAAVTAAIEATGLDYAPRVAATTVQLLDDHTRRWVSMAEDACGAALVAQGDDAEHQRRRQCLDLRLAEVGALVEALREPDAGMAESAVKATGGLTDGLSACTDPRRLAAYDVIEDPAARQRLASAQAKLAHAKAQGSLGHYDEAVALSTEVIDQARDADVAPLEALGLLTRGGYRERTGDPKGAEEDLRGAVALAERIGDPGTRAQALIALVYVVSQDRTRYDEAMQLGEQARAVLEYIDADPLLQADLASNLGVAERIGGDVERSLQLHLHGHELRVKVLGEDHPDIGRSLLNIGIAMGSSPDHYEQAEVYLRQALTSLEQSLGPHHPLIGTAVTNLGNCLARQERFDEALPLQRRALEIFERSFGADHVAAMRAVFNLAKITQDLGLHTEAAPLFRRGLESRERELGPDDPRLVGWLSHLARSDLALGQLDEAARLFERSLVLREASGERPLVMARDQIRLAQALAQSNPARAHEMAARAHATLRDKVERDGGRDATTDEIREWLDIVEGWQREHPVAPP